MKRQRSVDEFLAAPGPWRDEVRRLREIVAGCGLQETIKWGSPCYTLEGTNVVGLGAFKSYFRYVKAAAALARAGERIRPARRPVVVPPELEQALEREGATAAFAKLRPGQRREYAEFVGDARRAQTRQGRIAKIVPMIRDGVGLNDRYRRSRP